MEDDRAPEYDRPGKRVKLSDSNAVHSVVSEKDDPRETIESVQLNLISEPRVRYLVLHKVECKRSVTAGEDHSKHPRVACYLDVPRMYAKDSRGSGLRGVHYVADIDEYLENHPDICLLVYKTYDCETYLQQILDHFEKLAPENMSHSLFLEFRPWFYSLKEDASPAKALTEYIQIVSHTLTKGLTRLTLSDPGYYSKWQDSKNLLAPYDYFYHHQAALRTITPELLDGQSQEEIMVLLDYIQTSHGSEYDEADYLFSQGYVSKRFFTKLFCAREIVVSNVEGGVQAYMVDRCEGRSGSQIDLACWYWEFDGNFQRSKVQVPVHWPNENEDIVPVASLRAWPLRLDKTGILEHLEERGSRFWECRRRKLVSYVAPLANTFDIHSTNPRYMIDIETYRHLHPGKIQSGSQTQDQHDKIDMDCDEPPEGVFRVLLPPTVLGFGFLDKKWRTLRVEHIRDAEWNTAAFERLVLKSNKKELIQALVTVHLGKTNTADVVEGKGNGLILLLHGPPGTGKTLTAESVAELASKPLYRVTCGDIGTDPESVEKYLDSALFIGTIWGCVVLLDEADVFLEERTQTDLVRNALVSVFLRVLEYYDGILILTSNRVGTFDEAFKSRMQMAVHYPNLELDGRRRIWQNFFTALKEAKVDMNSRELEQELGTLASHNLNGRQIRNTIKTARQLATFKGERLQFKHLESVIDIANDFEDYLVKTKGHDHDRWARENQLRA
ncbi:hypothetical protein BP6252_12634 [Coleophoma cylindrospora]|uniref:AAA+ ATPase domain-containing protein n=1 Tax=Coleophoma cylindrospora TaxID=1849047 RepID=A0A3D8QCV5_9HELO|nr:hypothetical protein BP6252_12634 [Coleophoma cylindrospora]